MLKVNFILALRNLIKKRNYSFLNSLGLIVGIASFLVIYLYVNHEKSYDTFHENSERIYRVTEIFESDGIGERSASLPFPTGHTLKSDFDNRIEDAARMFNFQSPVLSVINEENDEAYNEEGVMYVDSTFFKVFSYEFLQGNSESALNGPNKMVITEEMAIKYFKGEDPVGKFLKIQGQENVMVTGVLKSPPKNSHLKFDFLISFSTVKAFFNGNEPPSWYWNPCWTYIKLREGVKSTDLEKEFKPFVKKYFPNFISDDVILRLQPLESVHLDSNLDYEMSANGSRSNVITFTIIGILILIIASINFINLATSRSSTKSIEVGIRKILGGRKRQITSQYLMEAMILTFISTIVALAITYLALPYFKGLSGIDLRPLFLSFDFLAIVVLVFIIISVGAGIYPAISMASISPLSMIRNEKGRGRFDLRKILVMIQFGLSVLLVFSTLVATKQLKFLQNSEMGFNEESVIMIPAIRTEMGKKYLTFKNELLRMEDIKSVTAVEEVLGVKHQTNNYQFEGMEKSRLFPRLNILHDFSSTFDLQIIAGRDFDIDIDKQGTFNLFDKIIINETMAKSQGWTAEEAVGQKLLRGNNPPGEVIGVVKDFNFTSKHKTIEPLALNLFPLFPGSFNLMLKYVAVRVEPQNINQAIASVEETFKTVLPDTPFEYFFLDDKLQATYARERNLSLISQFFSILAIFVACLGLIGLISFSVEKRKREIGIRKVLGSSISQAMMLVYREFGLLFLISFIIAVPLGYFFIDQWLSSFAYSISIGFDSIFLSGMIPFVLLSLSVSYLIYKAAVENPVEVLKEK